MFVLLPAFRSPTISISLISPIGIERRETNVDFHRHPTVGITADEAFIIFAEPLQLRRSQISRTNSIDGIELHQQHGITIARSTVTTNGLGVNLRCFLTKVLFSSDSTQQSRSSLFGHQMEQVVRKQTTVATRHHKRQVVGHTSLCQIFGMSHGRPVMSRHLFGSILVQMTVFPLIQCTQSHMI